MEKKNILEDENFIRLCSSFSGSIHQSWDYTGESICDVMELWLESINFVDGKVAALSKLFKYIDELPEVKEISRTLGYEFGPISDISDIEWLILIKLYLQGYKEPLTTIEGCENVG